MCSSTGCALEAVAFVDVTFPPEARVDASHDHGDDVDRAHPVGTQRVGFCIGHAAKQGLTAPITAAHAVKGHKAKGRFPKGHAFAAGWSWAVD